MKTYHYLAGFGIVVLLVFTAGEVVEHCYAYEADSHGSSQREKDPHDRDRHGLAEFFHRLDAHEPHEYMRLAEIAQPPGHAGNYRTNTGGRILSLRQQACRDAFHRHCFFDRFDALDEKGQTTPSEQTQNICYRTGKLEGGISPTHHFGKVKG